jgi:DUF971 family protein
MADVVDITIDRQRSVTLSFDDGAVLEFPLTALRQACPCATCRGQRDQGREPWTPRPGHEQPTVLDASLVGAWGLSFQWDDGHDTGIYSWDGLRRWYEQAEPGDSIESGGA